MSSPDRGAKARAVYQRQSAERALDNPVAFQRAVRIVRAALDLGRLTLDDLTIPAGEVIG